ncbi:hypothetical protein D3C75_1280710 [compost metagenome]
MSLGDFDQLARRAAHRGIQPAELGRLGNGRIAELTGGLVVLLRGDATGGLGLLEQAHPLAHLGQ